MRITFSGAAREVTGSCHLVEVNGHTTALDCGLFQGHRSEAHAKNRRLPIDPHALRAVVLSHAHIDHSGRLPYLTREGYGRSIYTTPASRDLSALMLADSAHIQAQDARHLARRNQEFVEPLYAADDAARTISQMIGVPYAVPFDPSDGVRATFLDAGHILGSASVTLDCTEGARTSRLVFSGDIGRKGLPIIRDPVPPRDADVLIMESTYGNRDHEPVSQNRERFATIIRETAGRGGRILIPAFAVGRTQELLYDLHLLVRSGEIPAVPIYVDSPLAIDTTSVFALHPDLFDTTEQLPGDGQSLFAFAPVRFTRSSDESKALNTARGPMIIIAASGMVESGRILHHLIHGAGDARNTILIVGFQAEHTLGRRIVERKPELKILGEVVPLRARVEIINGYSAHADRGELLAWAREVRAHSPRLRDIYLVHGEPDAQAALSATLTTEGFHVDCPGLGDVREF